MSQFQIYINYFELNKTVTGISPIHIQVTDYFYIKFATKCVSIHLKKDYDQPGLLLVYPLDDSHCTRIESELFSNNISIPSS